MSEQGTWQHLGEDHWVFGLMVRGLVRERLAEVYFDEDRWIWIDHTKPPGAPRELRRGVEVKLAWAVSRAEESLGVVEKTNEA